jgi:hypothetical protein
VGGNSEGLFVGDAPPTSLPRKATIPGPEVAGVPWAEHGRVGS